MNSTDPAAAQRRRNEPTWSSGDVARMLGLTSSAVSIYATRWRIDNVGVGHGSGSRARWTARDIALFRALLKLREQLGGQIPAAVVEAVSERMADARKGSHSVDVKMGTVTIRVPVEWDTPDTPPAAADSPTRAAAC